MAKTQAPAKTPAVAIARILRDLGLKQGSDFRIKGEYKGSKRIGTNALISNTGANQLVADHADEIERLAAEAGYHFNVSVHFTPSGCVWVWVSNTGQRTRQTHFMSPIGRTTNTATEAPKPSAEMVGDTLKTEAGQHRDNPHWISRRIESAIVDFPQGQRIQGVDRYGVTCMATVNGTAWGVVADTEDPNCGRTWVDVDWDEMSHNRDTGRRSRPFTDTLLKR